MSIEHFAALSIGFGFYMMFGSIILILCGVRAETKSDSIRFIMYCVIWPIKVIYELLKDNK